MLKKVGKVFKWGSAPNPGIFEDMIHNTGGKMGFMANC